MELFDEASKALFDAQGVVVPEKAVQTRLVFVLTVNLQGASAVRNQLDLLPTERDLGPKRSHIVDTPARVNFFPRRCISPMSLLKMVLVVRKDLGMRKGKIAAQTAHAACSLLRAHLDSGDYALQLRIREWFRTGQTKICVGVSSETELHALAEKAREAGVEHEVITDEGRTEFHGVPTVTCMALGPSSDLDPITGGLTLL